MTWINLFAVILVLGYTLWITYRGWRLFRNLLHASTISDVLKSILEQHHFYFIQGVGSLPGLDFISRHQSPGPALQAF